MKNVWIILYPKVLECSATPPARKTELPSTTASLSSVTELLPLPVTTGSCATLGAPAGEWAATRSSSAVSTCATSTTCPLTPLFKAMHFSVLILPFGFCFHWFLGGGFNKQFQFGHSTKVEPFRLSSAQCATGFGFGDDFTLCKKMHRVFLSDMNNYKTTGTIGLGRHYIGLQYYSSQWIFPSIQKSQSLNSKYSQIHFTRGCSLPNRVYGF